MDAMDALIKVPSLGMGFRLFQDEDARKYYRYELYEMGARAFRIDDADPK